MRRTAWIACFTLALGCSDDTAAPGDAGPGADVASGKDGSVGDAPGTPPDVGVQTFPCIPRQDETTACGGDPVGDWHWGEICGQPTEVDTFLDACPEAELLRLDDVGSATISFTSDGQYFWKLEDEYEAEISVPTMCVESYGGCEGFAAVVTVLSPLTMECDNTDPCTCIATGREEDDHFGTYLVDGSTLTMTSSMTGGIRNWHFCVMGDRAQFRRTRGGVNLVIEK